MCPPFPVEFPPLMLLEIGPCLGRRHGEAIREDTGGDNAKATRLKTSHIGDVVQPHRPADQLSLMKDRHPIVTVSIMGGTIFSVVVKEDIPLVDPRVFFKAQFSYVTDHEGEGLD